MSEASQQSQESSRSVEFVNFMRIIIAKCSAYFHVNSDIQSYEYLVFKSTSPWTVKEYIQPYLVFRSTSPWTEAEEYIQPYLVFRSTSPWTEAEEYIQPYEMRQFPLTEEEEIYLQVT